MCFDSNLTFYTQRTKGTFLNTAENIFMNLNKLSSPIRKTALVMMTCLFVFASMYAQIACNNSIQVSMDENCEVTIIPEMIIEGQHSDYSPYLIDIEGQSGVVIDMPGTYGVTVTDSRNNNSCWSKITIEDKLGPQLDCSPVVLPCGTNGKPGEAIITKYIANGHVSKTTQDSLYISFNFAPQIPYGATIHDISMDLYMEHEDISEMQAYLVSPHGKRIMLFDKPQHNDEQTDCLKKDMMVYMNDYASNPYHMMADHKECEEHAIPSMHGEYQPHDPFSNLKGQEAGGIWKLIVGDYKRNDYKASLKHCKLNMHINHGIIGLPFSGDNLVVTHTGHHQLQITGGDICGIVNAEYSDQYDENCYEDGAYFGHVTRTWYVTDLAGNVSSCVQPVSFDATGFDHFDMPYDYDGHYFPSYTCHTDFEDNYDEHGMPSPDITGRPTDRRNPNRILCGNIQVTYKDVKIDICEGSYKVLRNWTLINWCKDSPGHIKEHTQAIVVKDNVAPVVVCPAERDRIIKIRNPHECATDFTVPPPHIKYECSDYDWTVQYYQSEFYDECEEPTDNYYSSRGVTKKNGAVVIEDLGLGCVWIKYIVTDKCGNTTNLACQFSLLDVSPPVAICEEETVVSLGTDGVAKVFAQTFDDLSWDNCTDIYSYQVRKMNGICDTITKPQDYVIFCCEEIGMTVMVELTVADHYGNKNTCMVEATIQDKVNPYLACPDSVSVSCLTSIASLSDERYGSPKGNDNCGTVEISDVVFTDSLNQCGIGYVYKTWTLANDESGVIRDICTQVFSFEHHDTIGYHQVYFPNDTLLQGCAVMAGVDVTGEPVIHEGGCGLIAVNHEDTRFTFVDDACEKIIREWTVIDWCRYKPERGIVDGYWTRNQVIKIHNQDAPVFTSACEDVVVCSFDQQCQGELTMGISARDECSSIEDLAWEYEIDLYMDGSIDMRSSAVTFRNDSVFVSLDSIPMGIKHHIVWTVSDGCQNYARCDYGFTVEDCKAPTPFCISDVVTTLMQQSGEVEIWATDFDLKSEDNCTDYDDLKFSFSADTTDINRQFTCADIPNGQSATKELQVWLTDERGNQDFCQVMIQLQDNINVCGDVAGFAMDVDGSVTNEIDIPIGGVEVSINANLPGFPKTFDTGNSGDFSFDDLIADVQYQISSTKNDDIMNGISTLDIVLIQNHILGVSPFTSPYKIIAADIDNNQSVSVSDLIMLRRVILGAVPNFPNGQQSWRFLDKTSGFADTKFPFPFTEEIVVNGSQALTYDFMGVKIGDVNGSAQANLQMPSESRTDNSIRLVSQDKALKIGERIHLPMRVSEDISLIGMQQSLTFDPLTVSIKSIESSTLTLNESHIKRTANQIHMSWNHPDLIHLSAGEEFITIQLEVHKEAMLSDIISIDQSRSHLTPEVYDGNLTPNRLTLDFENDHQSDSFELYQNRPNPFELESKIGFELNKASSARLTIYDLSGKLVVDMSKQYSAGYNEIIIDKQQLGESGIFYYSLQVGTESKTKKLILLE